MYTYFLVTASIMVVTIFTSKDIEDKIKLPFHSNDV
jgi:hypothetical protein